MDRDLQRRLTALNQSFYRQRWQSFVARRQKPWPGWHRLLTILREDGLEAGARVLDLGCGHGRFAAFLQAQGQRGRYLGIDSSPPLVLSARHADVPSSYVCGSSLEALAAGVRFDLVVAFGLLHHIPDGDARLCLVREMAARVEAGGHLVVTLWNPDAKRRRRATAVAGGEPGDALLPWDTGAEGDRYCHFFDDDEVATIGSRLGEVKSFRADGRGGENHYLIHRTTRGAGQSVE